MIKHSPLAVIGGGPAGIAAAVTAAEAGVPTILFDAANAPGGQVYRPLPNEFDITDSKALGPDYAIGEALRRRLARSSVQYRPNTRIWSITDRFVLNAFDTNQSSQWRADHLIAATGTHERISPVPGWTLPGVVGLGAATIMLKSQHLLPGEATVVAGAGPLVYAVAAGILALGGRVEAVADLSTRAQWLGALPAMLARPDLVKRGAAWMRDLRRAGVPLLFGHTITRVLGATEVEGVELQPVDRNLSPRGVARRVNADALALGHGLVPASQVAQLLGADHTFQAERGGWIPVRNAMLESTVPGLFIAGDAGGISGAAAAPIEGEIAGLSVAHRLGALTDTEFRKRSAVLRRRCHATQVFGQAMSALMAPRAGHLATATADTTVCRCEDVSRAEIESALTAGAGDINQLKSWTRAGMGPCQGRMCGEAVAALVAAQVGGRVAAGQWTARVPITPVPIAALVGDFDYADIPQPTAAPQ